jgi:toxin ParE1/3/4
MRPRVLPEAEQEMLEAILWYEDRQEGLGEKFHEATRHAIEAVAQAPLRFPVYEAAKLRHELRRASVDRFPYYVVYEVRPDELLVVAVIHASRRPGYWTGRG